MPLARLRCDACSEPLGDAPYATLPVRCGACGRGTNVEVAADGAPPHIDAAFPVAALLAWLAAARTAMASGQPGVAVGSCPKCRAPLVVPWQLEVALPCPHCRAPRRGLAADVLVDQWPEPWARVEGPGTSLEYRVAVVDASAGASAGCAQCAWASPPDGPAACPRCGAATWAARPDGGRVQLGVRIDGVRDGTPMHALVPIAQGEVILRSDAARAAAAETGRSMLGMTGLGCAIAIAFAVLVTFGAVVALYVALHRP